MKESKEFLNLPVITITEGNAIATTTGFLINADEKRAVAIAVKDDEYYKGLKLIPVNQIIGVGKDALIINKPDVIVFYTDIASSESLLRENISVIGTTVMTSAGEIKGKVIEYSLDDNYNITEITVKNGDEIYNIPINNINVLAKKHTVINTHPSGAADNEQNNDAAPEFSREEWLRQSIESFKDGKLTQTIKIDNKTYAAGTSVTEELLTQISKSSNEKMLKNLCNFIE